MDIARTNNQSIRPDFNQQKKSNRKSQGLAVLILDEDGVICECNSVVADLLGVAPDELTFQKISFFLPQFKAKMLIKDNHVNPYLLFLSRIGHNFMVIDKNGNTFQSQLFFSEMNSHKTFLRMILCPI